MLNPADKKLFRLQYHSDHHLEFEQPKKFPIKVSADNLALLGDVGNPFSNKYQTFLADLSKLYKNIFVLAGNHSFYQREKQIPMIQVHEQIQSVCDQLTNVYYLNNKKFDIPDSNIRVIGSTLWTKLDTPMNRLLAQNYINDYLSIYTTKSVLISPDYTNELNRINVDFIQQQILSAKEENKRLIILSHHLPSYDLIHSQYKDNPLNCAFANHLDHLLSNPVVAWLCGHTHKSIHKTINGVICGINPVGYANENSDYDPECILEIAQ